MAVLFGFSCFFNYNGAAYNLKPAAMHLKSLTDQGFPCAFVGDYQGQLHFLGRITQPLATLSKDQAANWAKQHSNGFLLSLEKNKPQHASFIQPHREYWLVFRPAEQVSELDAR